MSEIDSRDYDPHSRQPRTLGELETWMYADDAFKRAARIASPIPINPPPIPGLDRLSAYCLAKYAGKLSIEMVNRLIGEYALAAGVSTDDAKAAALADVADLLVPKPNKKSEDDRQHAVEFRKLLDLWHELRESERVRLHVLARFEPPDESARKARGILDGLKEHGNGTARYVAEQTGTSGSALVLWWVESQLADNHFLDTESASRFAELRLVIDNALVQPEASDKSERQFMEMAINEARKSVGEDGRTSPKVGAVVVRDGDVLGSAHRGEMGKGEHAEFTVLEKKLANVIVSGATVYTTLEPCTTRNHPKIPCANRLIERRVKRVVIGVLDPNPKICGRGVRLLQQHGIEINLFPHDLVLQLEELNRDFTRDQSRATNDEITDLLLLDNPFRRLASLGFRINGEEWERTNAEPRRSITQEEFGKLQREFHQVGAECCAIARKLAGWNADEVKAAIVKCDKALIGRFRRMEDDPEGEDLTTWSHRASNRFTAALMVIQKFADEFDAEQKLGKSGTQ
jgi:pyrimidine deaminase RibD-like protein